MIKNTLFLLLFFIGISGLRAQTLVSGGIYNNVSWTLANSPYIVTGNIVVFPGKTLTIEPGVEVRVQGNGTWSNPGYSIEVRGTVNAVGTPNAPITFKRDTGVTASFFSWAGILVKTTQGGDGNLNYVTIEDAYQGWGSDGGAVKPGVQVIQNCTFRNNYIAINPWYNTQFIDCNFSDNGVGIQPLGSYEIGAALLRCNFEDNEIAMSYVYDTVTIDSCVFLNNLYPLSSLNVCYINHSLFDGNDVAFNGYAGTLQNCQFIRNNTGVTNFSGGSITDCVFRDNQVGIEIAPGGIFQNNEVANNVVGVKITENVPGFINNRICANTTYNVENVGDRNISLVGNCFCESDSTVAEGLLYDGYDDITRGLFNFAIYDSSCTNIVQLVSKVNIPTGVEAPQAALLSMYPVPARDYLQLQLTGGSLKGTVRLLNLQGQVLATETIQDAVRLNVSVFPAGIYLLEYQGAERQVLKWVKE